MKKVLTILAMAGVAAAVLASCSKNQPPVFDDAKAFIAFESLSTTVSEEDTINIPVSLASVAGLEGAVTFKVTADTVYKVSGTDTSKIWPKEGIHYSILTEGGTLKFDAKNRTQYITVAATRYTEYTGDLTIRIALDSKTTALGYNRECKVVISDIDHPLTSILGDYTTTSSTYAYPSNTYTMTFYKDETDDHKVWIHNLPGNPGWAIVKTRTYGNVTEEGGVLKSITIPFGQAVEYTYGTSPVLLAGIDSDDTIYKTGSVTATITDNNGTITLDFGEQYGFIMYIDEFGPYDGWVGLTYPRITAVKN